ncbi:MAG: hypothetical protein A3K19_33920 [Lentisphaerae bacterium RIFOXYB12_FULL_65_16]|nr:MAG: hypothetical protein A3K19_19155 [Lentisphaerae bacterium RIFOXYB12_FULL_65_16]OGV95212.1 MAG: hypothetical protein A3K19_33920 [Lentisphaerae bacterium RIFOXYB12_FULL_65_16]
MCLAVPGKLIAVKDDPAAAIRRAGTVDFQGSRLDVSLAFTPEANVGDWLLVHAGFAISRLDEDAAREVWETLNEAGLAGEAASAPDASAPPEDPDDLEDPEDSAPPPPRP